MRTKILLLAMTLGSAQVFESLAATTAGAGAGASAGASANTSGNGAFGTPSVPGNAGASANVTTPNTASPNVTTPNTSTANVGQTNAIPAGTNNPADTNQNPGTNQVSVTNQVFNTNQVFVTNQFFSTNFVSVSNRAGMGPNDLAASEFDHALILQVRQRLFLKDPGVSASWNAVGFAANAGTILVSGNVAQINDKENLLVLVRNTPGVVGVVDHVLVTPGASNANSGTVSRFLNPAPDPSLSESYRFAAPSNRFGQRIFTPPARGTLIATNPSPTGSTNPGSTNVVLEGVVTNTAVGTNVIIVTPATNSP